MTSIMLKNKFARRSLATLFALTVWQIAAMIVNEKFLFPTPSGVIYRLFTLLGEEGFFSAVSNSFLKIVIGFLSGLSARCFFKKEGRQRIIGSGALAHLVGSVIIKSIGLFQFYGYMVFWRIPLYLVIAPTEIFLICMLYKNRSFKSLIDNI